MRLSLLSLRRMVAGFLTLALIAVVLTVLVTPAAASGGLETFVTQNGNNRITVVADHQSGRTVTQVSNQETGTSRTTTTYPDGSQKTVVSSGGNTTTTCTDSNGNSIPCP